MDLCLNQSVKLTNPNIITKKLFNMHIQQKVCVCVFVGGGLYTHTLWVPQDLRPILLDQIQAVMPSQKYQIHVGPTGNDYGAVSIYSKLN
jgi:hypothetical protein